MSMKTKDNKVKVKYAVKIEQLPKNIKRENPHQIEYGYIKMGNHDEIICKKNNTCFLFAKTDKEPRKIGENLFAAYANRVTGRVVSKTKYTVLLDNGLTAYLEDYAIDAVLSSAQLATIEIEFDNLEQSLEFEPPEWIGDRVKFDERYDERNLTKFRTPEEAKEMFAPHEETRKNKMN